MNPPTAISQSLEGFAGDPKFRPQFGFRTPPDPGVEDPWLCHALHFSLEEGKIPCIQR
jgi:hypothetical protein